jgi:hypothetical protein
VSLTVADSKCATPGLARKLTRRSSRTIVRASQRESEWSSSAPPSRLAKSALVPVPVALMSLGFFAGVYTRPLRIPPSGPPPPGATPGDSESDSRSSSRPATLGIGSTGSATLSEGPARGHRRLRAQPPLHWQWGNSDSESESGSRSGPSVSGRLLPS